MTELWSIFWNRSTACFEGLNTAGLRIKIETRYIRNTKHECQPVRRVVGCQWMKRHRNCCGPGIDPCGHEVSRIVIPFHGRVFGVSLRSASELRAFTTPSGSPRKLFQEPQGRAIKTARDRNTCFGLPGSLAGYNTVTVRLSLNSFSS
jgi:hypothetical protein